MKSSLAKTYNSQGVLDGYAVNLTIADDCLGHFSGGAGVRKKLEILNLLEIVNIK